MCASPRADRDPRGSIGRGDDFCVAGALWRRVDLDARKLRRPRAVGVEAVGRDDVKEVHGVAVVVEVDRLRAVGDHRPVAALGVLDAEGDRPSLEVVVPELGRDLREHHRGEFVG